MISVPTEKESAPMTLDAKQVGKAMRRARVLAGMTVHELSEASQITAGALSAAAR